MKTETSKTSSIKKNLFIVVPAYNEEKSITKVLTDLKKHNYKNIIVVDDGSTDNTYFLAKKQGVIVLKHKINRGLGGALNTGITAALKLGADIIVTFDADGQHSVYDIPKIIKPIINGEADFVVGSRFLKEPLFAHKKFIVKVRRLGIFTLNILTYLLYGIKTTDSQSGFRAFSREAASKIKITANRMEVSSEFFREAKKNNLRYKEVPIRTIYTEYSLKKGQKLSNGFKIMLKLIFRKIID
ncbi:MAG: glycosyltransferase family 2 protein [Candidatus Woesearchaeota archaeon]